MFTVKRSLSFFLLVASMVTIGCAGRHHALSTDVSSPYEHYFSFQAPIKIKGDSAAYLLSRVIVLKKDYKTIYMDQVLGKTDKIALAKSKIEGNLLDDEVADINFSDTSSSALTIGSSIKTYFQANFANSDTKVQTLEIKNVHHLRFVEPVLSEIVNEAKCTPLIIKKLKEKQVVRIIGNIYVGDITCKVTSTNGNNAQVSADIQSFLKLNPGYTRSSSSSNVIVGKKMAFCARLDESVVNDIAASVKTVSPITQHDRDDTKSIK